MGGNIKGSSKNSFSMKSAIIMHGIDSVCTFMKISDKGHGT
jgi:hypothetical protein